TIRKQWSSPGDRFLQPQVGSLLASGHARMLGRGARTRSEPYSLFKQPISFPRRTFAPGVCILASLTPNEGWAERRETFGCVRSTRGARRIAARQAPSEAPCVP